MDVLAASLSDEQVEGARAADSSNWWSVRRTGCSTSSRSAAHSIRPSRMRLVDAHGHLNADRFDDDLEQVVASACAAGVERILVPGWNVRSSERALEVVSRWSWMDASVGVHPHDAAKIDAADWSTVEAWAQDERVVAIGETGLDSDRMFSPWPDQLENLRRNLALALATGKPPILHCRSRVGERDAQDALVAELRAAGFDGAPGDAAFGGRARAIVHSFSGPVDYAGEMLGMGCVISFSGLVFRKGEEASAAVAPLVPAERLLVETDSPFLSPPGGNRGRNTPEFVAISARWLAERRGVGEDGLAAFGAGLVSAYDTSFPRPTARMGPA
jgi:TatD DNase family protein